jgi:hypothetical protein
MNRATLALSSLAAVLFLVGRAAGAPCNKPDLRDTVPPDGANSVPVNAKLHARYAKNATYLGEEVLLETVGVGEEPVTATYSEAEGILSVTPEPPLSPNQDYIISWPRLRGLNASNLGKGATVHFRVGDTTDEGFPDFPGLTDVSWDVDREKDECTDSLEDRYVFDFDLSGASDDGGRESLMLLVFQTSGPGVNPSAPAPVLVRRFPASGDGVRSTQALSEGAGEICFSAIARDLTGKVSANAPREVCTETVEPPFFEGCSVGHARTRGLWLVMLTLAGLVLRKQKRA